MMRKTWLFLLIARYSLVPLCALTLQSAAAQTVGQPLPPWTPGTLDIHQIQTGRGNSTYFIFPDSTTMLLDAGAVPSKQTLEQGPARPNSTRSPAGWIAQYIDLVCPRQPPTLDYVVITHYHDDHMGAIVELAKIIPIAHLIDRDLRPPPPPGTLVAGYLEFSRSQHAAVFTPGRADQIQQLHNPQPDFEVRNISANGEIWTGNGRITSSRFPAGWQNHHSGLACDPPGP